MYTNAQPMAKPMRLPGTVAIISSAPRDNRVADECKIACQLMGAYSYRVQSLSTGNLRHLMSSVHNLKNVDVLIVCSGTDTALPGMLAGMVDIPVIALPSSTAPDGMNATDSCLHGMTPGVAAVAGGDGVAAAAAAARILHTAARYFDFRSEQMASLEKQQTIEEDAAVSDEQRGAANNVSSANLVQFIAANRPEKSLAAQL